MRDSCSGKVWEEKLVYLCVFRSGRAGTGDERRETGRTLFVEGFRDGGVVGVAEGAAEAGARGWRLHGCGISLGDGWVVVEVRVEVCEFFCEV